MTPAYIIFALLLAGFFYLTYKNSPRHAWMLLAVIALSIGIWFIKPIQMFSLLGIAGLLIIMILSVKARQKSIQRWLAQNGFVRTNIPSGRVFFASEDVGNKSYVAYSNRFALNNKTIPFLLILRYTTQWTGKTTTVVVNCSYYFNENVDTAVLQQQFAQAKENTPHTGLLKSQLHFFDLKHCDVFMPSMGGIAVSWRVPDTVQGYSERYQWIKNVITK